MNDQKEVWILQLTKYFVTHKNYTRVKFLDAKDKTAYDRGDVWLVNANAGYGIVHIIPFDEGDYRINGQQYRQLSENLIKVTKKETRVLEICLDRNAAYRVEDNFYYQPIYPNCTIDEVILSSFPGLDTVVFNVDDPVDEVARLSGNINTFVDNNNKKREKTAFKELVKATMSKTFMVAGGICTLVFFGVFFTIIFNEYAEISVAIAFGAYYKAFINALGEWYRLLTSGFVHVNILHFWCNMIALYNLSKPCEERFGFVKTMGILLLSIIMGNACVYVGEKNIVALGISGGIYGLLGALIVAYARAGYFSNREFRMRFFNSIYINILLNFLPGVSVLGHIGGLTCGLLLGLFLVYTDNKAIRINSAISFIIVVAALVVFGIKFNMINEAYFGTDMEVAQIFKDIGLNSISDNILRNCRFYYIMNGLL